MKAEQETHEKGFDPLLSELTRGDPNSELTPARSPWIMRRVIPDTEWTRVDIRPRYSIRPKS